MENENGKNDGREKEREKWSRLNEWMVIFIGKGGREKIEIIHHIINHNRE